MYIAELDIKKLSAASNDVVRYEPLPRFPAVERDIALIVDTDVPAGALLDCIRENAGAHFESAALFDVYTGDKVAAGKKSLAYTIVLRAKDRTLLDEEANAARDAVVAAAAAKFGAKLRE